MSGLTWYPRNSRKALDGMRRLTLEQRGAYNTILDLIYDRGAPVPDDDRYLAGCMDVSVRKWLILRQALIDAGRIIIRQSNSGDRFLSDERAEIELEKLASRRRVNAESGAIGGAKSSENKGHRRENSVLAQANAEATAQAPLKLETEEIEDTPPKPPQGGTTFDQFWEAYPSKVGKRAAEKSFEKAIKRIKGPNPIGVILAGLDRAKASKRWNDPTYTIPNPTTWLNQDRWNDGQSAGGPILWDVDRWRGAVLLFRDDAVWRDDLGPRPGEAGCRVPPEILRSLGYDRSAAA